MHSTSSTFSIQNLTLAANAKQLALIKYQHNIAFMCVLHKNILSFLFPEKDTFTLQLTTLAVCYHFVNFFDVFS